MKKTLILLTALALVAGILSATSVSAQEAPAITIPEVVQVDDPVGDANFLNDQDNAYGTPAEGEGDHSDATVGNATDLLKVWFTHTAADVTLNFQTNGDPSLLAYDTYFRFSSNPGTGEVAADEVRGCLQWAASVNGAGGLYLGETEGVLTDKCNVGDPVVGSLAVNAGPETTFVTSITFPRSYSPLLADGSKLTTPYGVSRVLYVAPGAPAPVTTAATVDTTKRGTDYELTPAGGPVVEEPPVVDPPPVDPPVTKPCKGLKGKAKKRCKKKLKASCPAITPAAGAEAARLTVVTDAATEAAPIEIPITAPAATPDAVETVFENLQVDSKAKDAGLYIRYEFFDDEDMDIYALNSDGSTAAQAAGFNPFPFIPNNPVFFTDGTGTGGHSEQGAEQIDGVLTPDCGGYSTQIDSFLSPGGERVMKVWLGPATWDPVAQAPIDGGE